MIYYTVVLLIGNVITGATIGYKYGGIYCFVQNIEFCYRVLFLRGAVNLCINAFLHAYKCANWRGLCGGKFFLLIGGSSIYILYENKFGVNW